MKKSLILALAVLLFFTSCGQFKEIFEETERNTLDYKDVCGKTTYMPFTHLNSPIVYVQYVFDEYDVNEQGEIAIIYDWENDEVFDWVYLPVDICSYGGVAAECQKSPDAPISYMLPSSSCYKVIYIDADGTEPRYANKCHEGSTNIWLSQHKTKPRYMAVANTSYFYTGDSYISGIIFNAFDCVDGSATETIGLQQINNYADLAPDPSGNYWLVSDMDLFKTLVYFNPVENKIIETDYMHSLIPADVLIEYLMGQDNPDEGDLPDDIDIPDDPDEGDSGDDDGDDGDFDPDDGTDAYLRRTVYAEESDGTDEPDDYTEDENYDDYSYYEDEDWLLKEEYGTEDIDVRYVNDKKVYMYGYQDLPEEKTRKVLIVVNREDLTSKEFVLNECNCFVARNVYRVFEINGKIWIVASGYYGDNTDCLAFFELNEEATEPGTCLIDKNYVFEELGNYYSDTQVVKGSRIYFFSSYGYENSEVKIAYFDVETGEEFVTYKFSKEMFNCPQQ